MTTNDTPPDLDPAYVLNAAADLIERDGWSQHVLVEFDESRRIVGRCPLGAINTAIDAAIDATPCTASGNNKPIAFFHARGRLIDYLTATNNTTASKRTSARIPDWNDHPDRTQTEVVATLRAAAATPPEQQEAPTQ